jgi:hypothetical protein
MFCLGAVSFTTISQNLILNPGFENHSLSNGCYTNQAASFVTSSLDNIAAFYGGTLNGVDIGVNDGCYAGGAHSGTTHIVLAGLSGPNMFEGISFELSSGLISGNTYDLSFYAANSTSSSTESLRVGVSSEADSFGTEATLVPLGSNSAYTQYSISFTAPASGNYLTIEPAVLGNFWFGLDDFSLELNGALSLVEFTNEGYKIFPNPSSDFIQVSGLTKNENYTLYNVLGAKIRSGQIYNNAQIDISPLNNGLYFLKFNSGTVIKILKN